MNNEITQKKEKIGWYQSFCSFMVALIPIISPYKLFGIDIVWIICVFVVSVFLIKTKGLISIQKQEKYFVLYHLLALILSINGLLVLRNASNLLNSDVALVLSMIMYFVLWKNTNIDYFIRCLEVIGYICCVYAFYQFVMLITGGTVPMGQLPFLEISSSQGWMQYTGGYRFNSLFSEPSYFAMYLLPVFAINLLNAKWIKACIFGFFIVLSSSSTGIIVMALIVVLFICSNIIKGRYFKEVLLTLAIVFILINILKNISIFSDVSRRSINKIIEIFSNTTSSRSGIRFLGYLNLFSEYSIKESLFGVGIGQLQNYFSERGIAIYNYSNSLVLSLLNLGILGFMGTLFYFMQLLMHSVKNHTMVYWLILTLVFSIDSVLFGQRFYYLLFFPLFMGDYKKGGVSQ